MSWQNTIYRPHNFKAAIAREEARVTAREEYGLVWRPIELIALFIALTVMAVAIGGWAAYFGFAFGFQYWWFCSIRAQKRAKNA